MIEAEKRGAKCPICGKAQEETYRPFCSKRCADVDLGRWFSGRYAIPDEEKPAMQPNGTEEDSQLDRDDPSR